MRLSCVADLVEVFSPLAQPLDLEPDGSGSLSPGVAAQGIADPHMRPTVSIGDSFFFRSALYRIHCRFVQSVHRISPRVRLCFEIGLLFFVLLQFTALVGLHVLAMPSPILPFDGSIYLTPLSPAVRPPGGALELLRVSVEAWPAALCRSAENTKQGFGMMFERHFCQHQSVQCELASEHALLTLPMRARDLAYGANSSIALSIEVPMTIENTRIAKLYSIPGIGSWVISRQILNAIVWMLLREEVRSFEFTKNTTNFTSDAISGVHANKAIQPTKTLTNSSSNASELVTDPESALSFSNATLTQNPSGSPKHKSGSSTASTPQAPMFVSQPATMVDKWAAHVTGTSEADLGADTRLGSSRLEFFSCLGRPPASLQPLRRAAELLHRRSEWWLFKAVWASSTSILSLTVGVAVSFTVRAAALSLFHIYRLSSGLGSWASIGDRLEYLEATVLVICPFALCLAICRVLNDDNGDVAAVLACQVIGEVVSFCFLRSEESRYIFPRAALPIYAADIYYQFFYPFGFTWLVHGMLFSFQVCLIFILLGHFEGTVDLPVACPDQLTVEVRLRPNQRQSASSSSPISSRMQQLLLEQGLLLLGDDRSYESAVVMSALVMRALQITKVPSMPPLNRAPQPPDSAEALTAINATLLGGGPATQTLVNYAHYGDAQCLAFLIHLVTRLWPVHEPLELPSPGRQASMKPSHEQVPGSEGRQKCVEHILHTACPHHSDGPHAMRPLLLCDGLSSRQATSVLSPGTGPLVPLLKQVLSQDGFIICAPNVLPRPPAQ